MFETNNVLYKDNEYYMSLKQSLIGFLVFHLPEASHEVSLYDLERVADVLQADIFMGGH